jgi:DNA-binding beta-propeller fold protein YncE
MKTHQLGVAIVSAVVSAALAVAAPTVSAHPTNPTGPHPTGPTGPHPTKPTKPTGPHPTPPTGPQAITPTVQDVPLPGSPFAVTPTPDGRYAFASLSGATGGIAIIKQGQPSASLVGVLPTGGSAFGLTVTRDGRYLLDTVQPTGTATAPQGVQIIDIQKAIRGQAGAILGTVPTGTGTGPIEVALSNDERYAFVTNEDNATVGVIDFRKALETDASSSSLIGNIPVDQLPVGLAFSPDGHYLYVSNETAQPTHLGYNPTACNTPTGIGTGTTPGPEGTLTVVNLYKAERDPADSVLADDYAGCSPVRVVLGSGGQVAWVTARAESDVLAFNTQKLLSDPAHDLISKTPVGVAPVGIQPFDNERLIAVANSNRFSTGQSGTVSILDYRKALSGAGSAATIGTFPAGEFPRQWGLSDDERTLYLTEFSSNTLAIFPTRNLIGDVQPYDPGLSGPPWDGPF